MNRALICLIFFVADMVGNIICDEAEWQYHLCAIFGDLPQHFAYPTETSSNLGNTSDLVDARDTDFMLNLIIGAK